MKYDTDFNGVITYDEFESMLKKMKEFKNFDFALILFFMFDTGNDGTIEIEEFEELLNKHRPQKQTLQVKG
jgi:Ca2+-binding EF-hand superfamily protein